MGLFTKDIETMDDLFVHQLRDIYYAENQIAIDGVLNWPISPYVYPDLGAFPQGWVPRRIVHNCLPRPGVRRAARTTPAIVPGRPQTITPVAPALRARSTGVE